MGHAGARVPWCLSQDFTSGTILKSLCPAFGEQADVRSGPHQPPGPVSVRRRCAAQSSAHALVARRQPRPAAGDARRLSSTAAGTLVRAAAGASCVLKARMQHGWHARGRSSGSSTSTTTSSRPLERPTSSGVRERSAAPLRAPIFSLGPFWAGGAFSPAKICLKSRVLGQIFSAGLRPAPRWGCAPDPPPG